MSFGYIVAFIMICIVFFIQRAHELELEELELELEELELELEECIEALSESKKNLPRGVQKELKRKYPEVEWVFND